MSKPGVPLPPGSARENPEACPSGIRHVGGAKLNQALVRNVRTCRSDAKGKGTSGQNREAESTDAPARGGLLRSSDEVGVMPMERREQVIAVELGQLGQTRRSLTFQWKAAEMTLSADCVAKVVLHW